MEAGLELAGDDAKANLDSGPEALESLIDENTALIGKLDGEWKAMGASKVHVMTRKQTRLYASGEIVSLV